jgi:hypothetical protein
MVEMTQPVNLALGVLNREAFFFQTSPIATSYKGAWLTRPLNCDFARAPGHLAGKVCRQNDRVIVASSSPTEIARSELRAVPEHLREVALDPVDSLLVCDYLPIRKVPGL